MKRIAAVVLAAACAAAWGAEDVRPISVRVRQTPGGPQLHLDGRPIPARSFCGEGPSVAFIAETREYTFTLPFMVPVDAVRAEVRIAFTRDPASFWMHDVSLVEQETGKVVGLAGSMADEKSFRAAWKVLGENTGGTVKQEGAKVKATVLAAPPGVRRPFYLASKEKVSDFVAFGSDVFNYALDNDLVTEDGALALADLLYQLNVVIDKEVGLFAMVTALRKYAR